MEEFLKNQMRLIQCYRASSGADEATEKCQQYADEMKRFANEGGFEYPNIMKDMWTSYYKTKNYYKIGSHSSGH